MLIIFETIGIIWLLSKIIAIGQELLRIFRSNLDIQERYGKGSWALITGATDGIGKGFCQVIQNKYIQLYDLQQLVAQGMNVCLIARNNQKALNLIEELKKQYKTDSQFRIITADFSKQDNELYNKIFEQIKNLDIGLLVNNVGVITTGSFDQMIEQNIRDMIEINCFPITMLTKLVVPLMLQRTQRSGIINLSSSAADIPSPYYQVYCATKAYGDFLSRSIAYELMDNIDVISLKPFYVSTNMTGNLNLQGSITVDQCTKGCLQRIGYVNTTYGYWSHRIQGSFLSLVPEIIQNTFKNQIAKSISEQVQNEQKKYK